MVVFGHHYLKLRILHNVIDLLKILLVIAVLTFIDSLEQLEVENGLMRMRVVFEEFDLPLVIQQVFIEERRVAECRGKELTRYGIFMGFELTVAAFLARINLAFHSEYILEYDERSGLPARISIRLQIIVISEQIK